MGWRQLASHRPDLVLTNSRLRSGGFDEKLFRALGMDPTRLCCSGQASRLTSPQVSSEPSRTRVIRLAGDAKRLCLAGGLGMNALLVSALERDREVFVQPAAGNAGTAIGAVLHTCRTVYRREARV